MINNTPEIGLSELSTLISLLRGLQWIGGLEDALLRVDAPSRVLRVFWGLNKGMETPIPLNQMGLVASMLILGIEWCVSWPN